MSDATDSSAPSPEWDKASGEEEAFRSAVASAAQVPTEGVVVGVNGRIYDQRVEPRRLLSDFLRSDLGLTGTTVGCEEGHCGSCTISLDGEPVRSCLLFAVQAHGQVIETVEGLSGVDPILEPLSQAFEEARALQCGFCAAGLLIGLRAFLRENPHPDEPEIRRQLSGNLCRCSSYQDMVEAVLAAAQRVRTEPTTDRESTE